MSYVYRRPMFRKGGSAEGGITSGLQRPGYKVGERVSEVMKEMRAALPARGPKRNFNDFLINFGLDIASRSPTGNILTTAAQSAKEPFAQFQQQRAGRDAFEDKLALGAYDIVRGEQESEKEFERDKALIEHEAKLNPKLKKVFREEIPEVRINEYADTLEDSDFDVIANNAMEISSDIVTFNVFGEKNPDHSINKKNFRGILQYEYGAKGEVVPNYESYQVGQVFYNPEDGLFYEKIADEGVLKTDYKALDPFTYD